MAWRVTRAFSPAAAARPRTSSSIVLGEPAGEGVLLAGVVAAEQQDLAVRRRRGRLGAVAEPRLRARALASRAPANERSAASQPKRRRARPRPGRSARAARARASIHGAQVSRSAVVGLFCGGAQRTVATIRVSISSWPSPACTLVRLRGQADPVQAREQPVAGAVAGEDPAGAVAAVRGRREADDQHPRRRRRPSRGSAGPSRARRRTTPACRAPRPRASGPAAGRPRQTETRASSSARSRIGPRASRRTPRGRAGDRGVRRGRVVRASRCPGGTGEANRSPGHRVRERARSACGHARVATSSARASRPAREPSGRAGGQVSGSVTPSGRCGGVRPSVAVRCRRGAPCRRRSWRPRTRCPCP